MRLSPSLAWPLRPSEVTAALGDAAELVHVAWASWHRRPSNTPLRATWDPPQPAVIGGWVGQGATLWIEPVARTDADRIRRQVKDEILDEACKWLSDALKQGDGWQASRHEATWTLAIE